MMSFRDELYASMGSHLSHQHISKFPHQIINFALDLSAESRKLIKQEREASCWRYRGRRHVYIVRRTVHVSDVGHISSTRWHSYHEGQLPCSTVSACLECCSVS